MELPFVVATYNCPHRYTNKYVQLLITSYIFYSIAPSYIIQGKASLVFTTNDCITSQFEELDSKKPTVY